MSTNPKTFLTPEQCLLIERAAERKSEYFNGEMSRSTEAYDRGEKFKHYRKPESLRDYLLISSQRVQVELFSVQDGRYVLTPADRMEDSIEIPSIGCRLDLADIYEKVAFEPAPLRPQNS